MSITQSASNSIEDLVEIFTTFVNVVAWICQRCYMHLHTLFVKNINFAIECNFSALTLSPINLRVWVSISKTLAPRCLRLGLKNFSLEEVSVSCFFGIKKYFSSNILLCQKVYVKEAGLSDP